jgi:hypothetical protein
LAGGLVVGHEREEVEAQVLAAAEGGRGEPRVDAGQAVAPGPGRVAVGHQGADERLAEEVAAQPRRQEVLPVEAEVVHAARLDVEQAHVPALDASGELEAGEDRYLLALVEPDAAAVEGQEVLVAVAEAGDLVDPRPLEEKWRSSASVSAKSVLTVSEAVRFGVRFLKASPPTLTSPPPSSSPAER